jgi:outer membrane protein OmpA-like peptidoglycan-associated protein
LKVGEAIEVNNLFYDTKKIKVDEEDDTIIAHSKDYEPLLNLVNDFISLTDSVGINQINEMCQESDAVSLDSIIKAKNKKKYEKLLEKIGEAIRLTDTLLLKKITENTIYKDKTTQVVYFVESNVDKALETVVLGKDTVKALRANTVKPIIRANDLSLLVEVKHDSLQLKQDSIKPKKLNLIAAFSFYFASAEYKIRKKDKVRLKQIALFLRNNPTLLVVIEGHTDTDGGVKMNYELSRKRGVSIMTELKRLGVNKRQFRLLALGEPKQKERTLQEKRENRRVDIKIMELVNEK